MKKLIKNYTTTIPMDKTVSEIQKLLSENGATAIGTEYEEGILKRIFFRIKVKDRELAFKLPAKPEAVYNALFKGMRGEYNKDIKEERMHKSEMIAWRVCKLWLEAQITHINLEQADIVEVFLPYMVTGEDKTLYDSMQENNFMLESGKSEEGEVINL